MEVDTNVGGRDRLARAVLAVVLSIAAVRWLRAGKKGRGLLAGVGSLVFGFNATTGYCGANDALGIDTASSDTVETAVDTAPETDADDSVTTTSDAETTDARLTCVACGEPIEVGQSREPNENDQIVHSTCN